MNQRRTRNRRRRTTTTFTRRLNESLPKNRHPIRSNEFHNGSDVYRYARDMGNLEQEHVLLLCLDAKNRLIHEEVISKGTANCALIHPRDVFRVAIVRNSLSFILVHNHPSGDPTPSKGDCRRTEEINAASRLLGIEFYDHVIVGREGYVSLKSSNPDLFGFSNPYDARRHYGNE